MTDGFRRFGASALRRFGASALRRSGAPVLRRSGAPVLFLWSVHSVSAAAGPLTDRSDLVLEGDVVTVTERMHEVIPGMPVRVFSLEVTEALRGTSSGTVDLVLAGGETADAVVSVVGSPSLAVGDHVVVFCTLRSLTHAVCTLRSLTHAVPAEPLGLRLTSFGGVYRRAGEGGASTAVDGFGHPLSIDHVDGGLVVETPRLAAEDEVPVVADAVVPASWSTVIATLQAEALAPGSDARPALALDEVVR